MKHRSHAIAPAPDLPKPSTSQLAGAKRIVDANAGTLATAQIIDATAAGETASRVEGRIVRLD